MGDSRLDTQSKKPQGNADAAQVLQALQNDSISKPGKSIDVADKAAQTVLQTQTQALLVADLPYSAPALRSPLNQPFLVTDTTPKKGTISKPQDSDAKPGTVRWFLENGLPIPAAPAEASGAGAKADAPQAKPKDCAPNKSYLAFIDKAARNYYDPKKFGDIDALKNKYNCEVKTPQDAMHFAHEALKVLDDPFTGVMMPSEVNAFNLARAGRDRSVGVNLTEVALYKGAAFKVDSVDPGSAAETAGLKKGDEIKKVNGVSVEGRTLKEVSSLINASDSTTLSINVMRDGKPVDINFQQKEKELEVIKGGIIKGTNIAYLRIDSFGDEHTAAKMKEKLEKYKNADGFIIDVRDNTGGLLDQGMSTASLFVKEGLLLTVKRREDSDPAKPLYSEVNYHLTDKGIVGSPSKDKPAADAKLAMARMPDSVNKPTIVLINGGTASAAEIFAAALRDNGDAELVGTKSYGKGIGQTVFTDLPDGAYLKATTFQFFTPKGKWLGDGDKDARGIEPDTTQANTIESQYAAPTDEQFKLAVNLIKLKSSKK